MQDSDNPALPRRTTTPLRSAPVRSPHAPTSTRLVVPRPRPGREPARPHRDGTTGRRRPAGGKKVIVQLFEWNWPSVASECQSTLGPKGYGYVQVSPPQEHVRGNQWWLAYQPVSYRIESRKGTRAQFQSMVNTCHAAGVKVIVDAVINHMSGQANGASAGPARPTRTTTTRASTRPRTSTTAGATAATTSPTTTTGTRCRTANWSTCRT
ncbi:alpha-amylase family glycosyl hydrolase [Micromonospora sp. M12]